MGLKAKFAEIMGLAEDLAKEQAKANKLAQAWEEAILSGEEPPEMDYSQINEALWKHPANIQNVLIASCITRGAAEAYGWRRYWLVLAISTDDDGYPDEEKAYRYAKRWARARNLRLEGIYPTSPFELHKVEGHVVIPQRFDASQRG